MKLNYTQTIDIKLTRKEIAKAIFEELMEKYLGEEFDDAGLDLLTDDSGVSYCGSKDWVIHRNPECASLIDAYNLICYNKTLKVATESETKKHTQTFIVVNNGDRDVGVAGFTETVVMEMTVGKNVAMVKEDIDYFNQSQREFLTEIFSHTTPTDVYTLEEMLNKL